jgi:sigma-B regulation protein RsbU (phosphoserine phosphatase)
MDLDLNDFLGRIFRFMKVLLPSAVILVLLLAFMSSQLLRRHIISHLTAMADAAREYTARDKVTQPDDAPFIFEHLDINTSDELEELWRSMAEMESDVRDTMIRLRSITAEQERMGAELSIATEIQEGTLPKDFPAFPERKEFDIYASMKPAKEVGGDLYDFFMVDDDHLAMVIGDVSGKGISAALFMVMAKTIIHNQTMMGGQDPAVIFDHVNSELMKINKAHMFVTVWLGILTISTGELIYADAGHEYPAIHRKGEDFTVEKDEHCAPLAARKKMKFKSGIFRLYPGDTLYVYTDGVTEANNAEGAMFGRERMLEALNRDPDAEPEIIDRNMHEALASFVQDAPQFDDTTMLVMKYYG